ncbi:hypothetical protein O9Z70_04390 [Devosia sp. YIM 151766]|uniref:hypothetical protein n=1 Tax=Devosia sp. YIM 151766 TaxID=3017325 RepID=UPI00255C33FF|nr:hypothetical protein [Devosia sp. YIM 151766]WIY53788.1 hypothetical protein O9Z70_04390 [Devosia sp. YIM 151766]
MIVRTALLFVALLLPNPASAQAFGFTMGTSLEELEAVQQVPGKANYRYVVVPPTPNPRLENYSAIVTPQDGLCQVMGATPGETPERAEQLRSILHTALQAVYGEGTKISERETVFGNTTPPVMAAALRIGRNNTTVMVEYVFSNYASCSINAMKLDQIGL